MNEPRPRRLTVAAEVATIVSSGFALLALIVAILAYVNDLGGLENKPDVVGAGSSYTYAEPWIRGWRAFGGASLFVEAVLVIAMPLFMYPRWGFGRAFVAWLVHGFVVVFVALLALPRPEDAAILACIPILFGILCLGLRPVWRHLEDVDKRARASGSGFPG